jgi:hypothetical protein
MAMNIDWQSFAFYWILAGTISVAWYNYTAAKVGKTFEVWKDLIVFALGPVELISWYCFYLGRRALIKSRRLR